MEEIMLKRIELKNILASQQIEEVDDSGRPLRKFDLEFKLITKRKCAINEYIKPD